MQVELKAFGAVAASAASMIPGAVTVATLTAPAPGIAGMLGFTATTVVSVPLAAPVILGAGLIAGGCAVHKYLKDNKQNK